MGSSIFYRIKTIIIDLFFVSLAWIALLLGYFLWMGIVIGAVTPGLFSHPYTIPLFFLIYILARILYEIGTYKRICFSFERKIFRSAIIAIPQITRFHFIYLAVLLNIGLIYGLYAIPIREQYRIDYSRYQRAIHKDPFRVDREEAQKSRDIEKVKTDEDLAEFLRIHQDDLYKPEEPHGFVMRWEGMFILVITPIYILICSAIEKNRIARSSRKYS